MRHCIRPRASRASRREARLRERGLTLLEILVVLVIIGVIVNFAVLSVGSDRNDVAGEEMRRLAALVDLASQEAVLGARELVLELNEHGYGFFVLDEEDKLVALEDDDILRERRLPEGMRLTVDIEGDPVTLGDAVADKEAAESETAPAARLFLLSSGEIAQPFEVMLEVPETGKVWRLTGGISGKLDIVPPDNT